MIYLILDIFIYNYTKYKSYFFLVSLYNKNIIYYIGMGLILDFIVFNTFLLNSVIILIIYFINKFFSRYNIKNIYIYLLNLLVDYIVYISITNLVLNNALNVILVNIGKSLILNLLFYFLCFKLKNMNIIKWVIK